VKKEVKAFLFDLNGTMIDDMEYHIDAWFDILNKDLNANLDREQVRGQMYGKNSELLKRVFGEARFSLYEIEEISKEKERRYQQAFKPQLKLIRGLAEFLDYAREHQIKMAIGSAAIPFNIDFVLDNLNIRHYFNAVVSANDVVKSKPDPETFINAAKLLGCKADACVVFEDAPKGVESALRAGMETIVITTMHSEDEFTAYSNIKMFIRNYDEPRLRF
jgi:beta-phosphoglucomutase family hydrolase